MKIDQSRYKAFVHNPEKYRITYQCNVVPKGKNFYLQRGITFHLARAAKFLGWTDQQIQDELVKEEITDQTAIESGMYLAGLSFNTDWGYDIKAVEVVWEYKIPDTPHSMVGRSDEVLQQRGNERVLYGEWKTTGNKLKRGYAIRNWQTDEQAGFGIIGLYASGYTDKLSGSAVIQYVQDSTPAEVWVPFEVDRSEFQQHQLINSVAKTCDMIEGMIAKHGIDNPWPHFWLPSWLGGCDPDKCEYNELCGMSRNEWDDLSNFTERREHLDIITSS